MSFLNNLLKAAVDTVAIPVKTIVGTLDGEGLFDSLEEALEDVKADFED